MGMATQPEGTPAGHGERSQVPAHVLRLRRALNNELETLRRAAEERSADSMDGALYVLEGLVDDLVGLVGLPQARASSLPADPPTLPPAAPAASPADLAPAPGPEADSWSSAWAATRNSGHSPRRRDPSRWLFYGILAVTGLVGLIGFFVLRSPTGAPISRVIPNEISAPGTAPIPVPASTTVPNAVPDPVFDSVSIPSFVAEAAAATTPVSPAPVSMGLDAPFHDLPRHWAARSMAADGDYVGAAGEWERMLGSENPESFTLLIEIDCRTRTLEEQYTLFADDPAAIFKPIRTGDRDYFLLMYGLYDNAQTAEAALADLPPSILSRSDAPLVRRLRNVM